MYLQDGRQWGSGNFQTAGRSRQGTVRSGTVLRAAIRLEVLKASDLVADASAPCIAAGLTGVAAGRRRGVEASRGAQRAACVAGARRGLDRHRRPRRHAG